MYLLVSLFIFKRNFSNILYIYFIWFLFFYIYAFCNDYCYLKLGMLINLELAVNQILQFFFKIDNNYVFVFIITVICLFLSNYFVLWPLVLFVLFLFFCTNATYLFYHTYLLDLFKVNEKLINGLFMVHPILTYIFYASILSLTYVWSFYLMYCNQDMYLLLCIKYSRDYYIKFVNKKYLYVGLVALLLGAWWAQQEINWNGWWGWDFVEIANLSVFVYIICLYHISNVEFAAVYYKKKILVLFFTLFVYSICLRYNVFNSLHTFLGAGLMIQIYWYVYIFISALAFVTLFMYLKFYALKKVHTLETFSVLSVFFNSINFCIIIAVIFSFWIVDYFMYIKEEFLLVCLFIFLMLNAVSASVYSIIFIHFLSFFDFSFILAVLSVLVLVNYRFTRVLHSLVYVYILLFILRNCEPDYFLWDYDVCVSYIFTLKHTLLYSFYSVYDFLSLQSNYIKQTAFFVDIDKIFFIENKFFFKNSLYVSSCGLLVNQIYFEAFEFKLFFSFIEKLYSLLVVLLFYLFLFKIKKNKVIL